MVRVTRNKKAAKSVAAVPPAAEVEVGKILECIVCAKVIIVSLPFLPCVCVH